MKLKVSESNKRESSLIQRYNDLMDAIMYEEKAIGYYDPGEDGGIYNLEQALKWLKTVLATYYESGHSNNDFYQDDPKAWRSHVGKIKRMITAIENFLKP